MSKLCAVLPFEFKISTRTSFFSSSLFPFSLCPMIENSQVSQRFVALHCVALLTLLQIPGDPLDISSSGDGLRSIAPKRLKSVTAFSPLKRHRSWGYYTCSLISSFYWPFLLQVADNVNNDRCRSDAHFDQFRFFWRSYKYQWWYHPLQQLSSPL